MTREELLKILDLHKRWIQGHANGVQAGQRPCCREVLPWHQSWLALEWVDTWLINVKSAFVPKPQEQASP